MQNCIADAIDCVGACMYVCVRLQVVDRMRSREIAARLLCLFWGKRRSANSLGNKLAKASAAGQ